jgi:Glyoxalase/Bleomycin resistance protein/Dioxygenase superfamily
MQFRLPSRRVPRFALAAVLSGVLALVSVGLPTTSRTSVAKPGATRALAPALGLVADVPSTALGRPFEVGYTVTDLDAAMAQFTQALGIQWGPMQNATLNVRLENNQVKLIRLDAVVSLQGPPYLELVRGVHGSGDNPWKATPTFSPVHLGYAVTNLAASSDALVAAGFPRIATLDVPGQSAALFAYHRGPGNITVEVLDATIVPPGVCDTPGSPFCAP